MATAFRTDVADPQLGHYGEFMQKGEVLFGMATGVYTLTVPTGALITRVCAFVTEAFDGTSPTITVGDGDDIDGYFTSALIAPATAGSVTAPAIKWCATAASAPAYTFGKYYASGDTIDVTYTAASGSPTTGKCVILAWGVVLPKCGIPAGLTYGAVL